VRRRRFTDAKNSNYANVVVSTCLRIKSKDEVLIFADKNNLEYAEDFAYYITKIGGKVSIFYIADSIRPIKEITDVQAVSLISANIIIYIYIYYKPIVSTLIYQTRWHLGIICVLCQFSIKEEYV
jgi:hypothetical protein